MKKNEMNQETRFSNAAHSFIVSDLHLADAEPPHAWNPLWKRFKRPKLFIDRSFRSFLEFADKNANSQAELILNGDIFDFDSVMAMPDKPAFRINWLEKKRGLASEERKSRYKIGVILNDHSVWTQAMREFILKGNRVVFVIGNHDMELHWPSVQSEIKDILDLPEGMRKNVRFCEWFYISNKDTLIEHGNQYDAYCLCTNPIHPLIKKGFKVYVRLPFGNLAGKLMLNGMGLMNPHFEGSYIKSSLKEYGIFFYKYILRTQPLILFTWLWSAMVTLLYSFNEGLHPALKDPLTTEKRVMDIALRANATPRMVRSLRELHVHPAIFRPMMVLKELWLDRALLLIIMLAMSFQFFSTLNVFVNVTWWWFAVPFLLLMPFFVFYARSVESAIYKVQVAAAKRVPMSSQIANVGRVVHGHTHREMLTIEKGIELVNTGTWSPAFHDVECTKPYGRKCFAWIKPSTDPLAARTVELFEWFGSEAKSIPKS